MIRTYTSADLDALIGIYRTVEKLPPWNKVFPNGCGEAYITHEIETVLKYPDHEFLVYVGDKGIIGFAQAHPFGPFLLDEVPHINGTMAKYREGYYLRNIIVHPNHWKSGTGKQLLQAIKNSARHREYPVLVTRTPQPNTTGREFFKKSGFEEVFEDKFGSRVYFVME
jgi:GNAT superfamily N-acetyltransferase